MNKIYTGIGSRDITDSEFSTITHLAQHLAKEGWTLRSGGAGGSDIAFEQGCAVVSGEAEIFIPWKGFGGKVANVNSKRYIPSQEKFDMAAQYLIDNDIIPWFGRMKQGAQKLHARNYYQCRGFGVNSDLMVYCAEDDKHGTPKGGTRTSIVLARTFGIPTYNIRVPEQLALLKGLIYEAE